MIIFLTYISFKTWGDILLISCVIDVKVMPPLKINYRKHFWNWHAGAPPIWSLFKTILLTEHSLSTEEFFSLLVSLSLTFNSVQLLFEPGWLQEDKNKTKGRKILTMLNLISGAIRLKIRSLKSAIIPFVKFLWLLKFESLLSFPFRNTAISQLVSKNVAW